MSFDSDQPATTPEAEATAGPDPDVAAGTAPDGREPVSSPDQSESFEGDDSLSSDQFEEVEVDVDGETYRIPKALKSAFMKNADYTRKTQEVAAQRRALEAHANALAQQAQVHGQDLAERGQLQLVNARLEQLRAADWAGLQQQNPAQFTQLNAEFTQLKDAAEQLSQRIVTRQQQSAMTAQRDFAKRIHQSDAVLSRQIPGWGPDMGSKLASFARANGVSDQQLRQLATNPAHVKLLHSAFVGAELLNEQRAGSGTAGIHPVPKVPAGRSGRSGPSDRQSTKTWMEARNRQLAKSRTG